MGCSYHEKMIIFSISTVIYFIYLLFIFGLLSSKILLCLYIFGSWRHVMTWRHDITQFALLISACRSNYIERWFFVYMVDFCKVCEENISRKRHQRNFLHLLFFYSYRQVSQRSSPLPFWALNILAVRHLYCAIAVYIHNDRMAVYGCLYNINTTAHTPADVRTYGLWYVQARLCTWIYRGLAMCIMAANWPSIETRCKNVGNL